MSAPANRAQWRRPAVLGLALMLLLNLVAALVFTLPRDLAERSFATRVRTLRSEVQARQLDIARADRRRQLLADNARDERRMLEGLIGTREETLAPILSEIEASAREFGLTLGSYSLAPEDVEDTPLTRLKITLPVEGAYTSLVGFLRHLERSKRVVTVDELKLSERVQGPQGHTTSLNLGLSAYVRSAPGEPMAGRGTHAR